MAANQCCRGECTYHCCYDHQLCLTTTKRTTSLCWTTLRRLRARRLRRHFPFATTVTFVTGATVRIASSQYHHHPYRRCSSSAAAQRALAAGTASHLACCYQRSLHRKHRALARTLGEEGEAMPQLRCGGAMIWSPSVSG